MAAKERILVVEHDPDTGDLIVRQTLKPMGFNVRLVEEAATAIQQTIQFSPDVIIANLALPGLSGKDLLAALASQGAEIPVIAIAAPNQEHDVIQAFRLGATDYLQQPIRETELVSAVERALQQVRARHERKILARQLQQANEELQQRVRELTAIAGMGKAVTSITDQNTLFNKIIEGAVYVTNADMGWLLLRTNDNKKTFDLVAQRNLPQSIAAKLHQPWDDGISSLVALSGEALIIHGTPLNRFKVSRMGKSVMVIPIKAQNQVIGLLVMVRKAPRPFSPSNQTLLEAVADYATISLMNVKLFTALEERAQHLQKAAEQAKTDERIKSQMLQNVSHELRTPLVSAKGYVDMMLDGQIDQLTEEQTNALKTVQAKIAQVVDIIASITNLRQAVTNPVEFSITDLTIIIHQAIQQAERTFHQQHITIHEKLPKQPVLVMANGSQIMQVLSGLLSNSIKFSDQDGEVTVTLVIENQSARVSVSDQGIGIQARHIDKIFEPFYQADGSTTRQFGGIGIGLALVKEIISSHGGQVQVDSTPQKGSTFSFTLPLA